MTVEWWQPSLNAHLPGAVVVSMIPAPTVSAHDETREESGMEKLLGSLSGTIIAGFVLTVIVVLLIHAIH
jgi:hypothetical protein